MNADLLLLRLSNGRVFTDLSAAELNMLADFGRVQNFAKDASPVKGTELVTLLTGSVRATLGTDEDGKPWTKDLGPGAVLNELAFLGREADGESAVCLKATAVFVLERKIFEKLVALGNASAAKIGVALARSIATRLEMRSAALLKMLSQHEALLESMERLLTDPEVQAELFGAKQKTENSTEKREFSSFKDDLLSKWDY